MVRLRRGLLVALVALGAAAPTAAAEEGVSLTMTPSAGTVKVGDAIDVELTITAASPSVTGSSVTVYVPDGFTATLDKPAYSFDPGTRTGKWTPGSIDEGDPKTATLKLTSATRTGKVLISAHADAGDGTTDDKTSNNVSRKEVYVLPLSDLAALTLKEPPGIATEGDSVTYTVRVSNTGTDLAGCLEVVVPSPDGWTSEVADQSHRGKYAGGKWKLSGSDALDRKGSANDAAELQIRVTAKFKGIKTVVLTVTRCDGVEGSPQSAVLPVTITSNPATPTPPVPPPTTGGVPTLKTKRTLAELKKPSLSIQVDRKRLSAKSRKVTVFGYVIEDGKPVEEMKSCGNRPVKVFLNGRDSEARVRLVLTKRTGKCGWATTFTYPAGLKRVNATFRASVVFRKGKKPTKTTTSVKVSGST